MTPGDKIKEIRLMKGLSRARLAKRCKLSEHTIYIYETNRREPHFNSLVKIAKGLGRSLSIFNDCHFKKKAKKIYDIPSELTGLKEYRTRPPVPQKPIESDTPYLDRLLGREVTPVAPPEKQEIVGLLEYKPLI